MQPKIYSFDGTQINDGSNYEAWIRTFPPMAETMPQWKQRQSAYPYLSNATQRGASMTLSVKILSGGSREDLRALFDTSKTTSRTLIVLDENDSNKQWYIKARPTRFRHEERAVDIYHITLAIDDPVWRAVTAQSETWAVSASGDTKTLNINGNKYAKPIFTIAPTSSKSGGLLYRHPVQAYNNVSAPLNNYPLDITGGGLDTTGYISAGEMQADGDDIRVSVNGVYVDKWVDGINTTSTKIWIVLDWLPKVELTLDGAIAAADTVTTLTVKDTTSNRAAIQKLAAAANKTVLIGSEKFAYTGASGVQITGVTRAAKDTTAADHADGDTIRWIQYDIMLLYGNSSLAAQDVDDSHKPIFDLDSTNSQWDYSNYRDADNPSRAGVFTPQVTQQYGSRSAYYTANHATRADVASEMGMTIKSYEELSTWRAETATILWSLYHPCGITTVTADGEKYYADKFPSTAGLEKSLDGTNWESVWNEGTPTAESTWETFSQSSVSLGGTYNYIRFILDGNMAAMEGAVANFEIDNVSLVLTNVPSVTLGSRITASNTYNLDARIKNDTSGEYIDIVYPLTLGENIEIDTDKKTVTTSDGTNARGAVTFSTVRGEWLKLDTGSVTLSYTESGAGGVTITIEWEERKV